METLRFAEVARVIASAARSLNLEAPAFRVPPRVPGKTRTLRKHEGGAVVSVLLKDRTDTDVIVDLVVGTLKANGKPADCPEYSLLMEAAYDAARLTPPEVSGPPPSREDMRLVRRPKDDDVDAEIARVNRTAADSSLDPPCLDDPDNPIAGLEPF